MNKKDHKIVFFGTPQFAVESLSALYDNGYDIAAVVTMPDKIGGRGHKVISSDVKRYAESKSLPILQPSNLKSEEFISSLKAIDADLFIVIAFRMLPEMVWSMPHFGTFNLHASLLPKYRGAAPINRAVMNGETKTGVTTFFINHKIDEGNIISQREIDILPDENVGDIHDKLMKIGAELVLETVDGIFNNTIIERPQPEGEFIPANKIFREDCIIDWKRPAEEIHNQIRGLSPYPAAQSTLSLESAAPIVVKIFKTVIPSGCTEKLCPGEVKVIGKRLFVATATDFIEILELQPAGKSRMATSAFLQGYKPLKFD